jgi:hypothetical protein
MAENGVYMTSSSFAPSRPLNTGGIMTKRAGYLGAAAILALSAISAPGAQAAYVMTFEQEGANVVEIGSGSLDLTDLEVGAFGIGRDASVDPLKGRVFSGVFTDTNTSFATFNPASIVGFGPGSPTEASSTSGGPIGFASGVADLTTLIFPADYVSGAPLSDFSTYLGASIASLGLAPGAHVWSWGSGDHADSFTIDVVTSPPLPVPESGTWVMMLLGFAGLSYAALRRKNAAYEARAWGSSTRSADQPIEFLPRGTKCVSLL